MPVHGRNNMRRTTSTLALCLAAGMIASPAMAQQLEDTRYDGHFAFGDSLSDNGNLFDLTNGVFPPPPYNERFTDEFVTLEYLAPGLQTIADAASDSRDVGFAYGGATAAPGALPPGFEQQIALFDARNITIGSNDLVSVLFGANDFFNAIGNPANQNDAAVRALAATSVGHVVDGAEALADRGARNFLFYTMPDLSATPAYLNSPVAAEAALYSDAFGGDLRNALRDSLASAPEGTTYTLIDLHALLGRLIANPQAFGLSNVTQAYTATGSGDPTTYLYFDEVHPTSTVNRIAAAYINEAINPEWALAGAPALGRASLENAKFVTDNTMLRLERLRAGALSDQVSCAERAPRFYAGASRAEGGAGGDGVSRATSLDGNIYSAGVDVAARCDLTVGIAFDRSAMDGKIGSTGGFDLDSFLVNAYALWRPAPRVFFDASVGGGYVDLGSIRRQTNVLGIVTEGETSGSVIDAHLRGGYDFFVNESWTLTPSVGLRYARAELNPYAESNGAGLDFAYDRQMTDSTVADLGLAATHRGVIAGVEAVMNLSANYLFELNDGDRDVSGALADNLTGTTYITTLGGISDRLDLGAGVSAQVADSVDVQLAYRHSVTDEGPDSDAISARVNFAF